MGVSYLDPTQPIGVSCCFCNKLPYHRGPNCTSFVCFCCGVQVLAVSLSISWVPPSRCCLPSCLMEPFL